MSEIHCITPQSVKDRLAFRDEVLMYYKSKWPKDQLRKIALLDFDLIPGPNGHPVAQLRQ